MKNTVILMSVLFCACNFPNKSLFIYEREDGLCAFILDDNVNVWAYGNTAAVIGDLTHVDSINFFRDDFFFIKKEIFETDFSFDSLYAANEFDLYGNWANNMVLYNAKIYQNHWEVGVYYPFFLKGTYTFSISDEEKKLYNSLLALCDISSSDIYPCRYIIDSLNEIGYARNHDFYFSIFQNGNEKSIFSLFPYLPKNSYRLFQLTSVIINNHIREMSADTSFIGVLDVRKKFDELSQNKTGTKKGYSSVHDIDSMAVWVKSSKNKVKRK